MVFDFTSLQDKLRQQLDLSQTLRSDNAALRVEAAALAAENVRLRQRMQEVHDRLSALVATLPADTEYTVNREAA
jgi:Tfp pilus assembly protein PilO